ncbi:MAG: TonB-dependent receptor [Pseudomonadota bacterium]
MIARARISARLKALAFLSAGTVVCLPFGPTPARGQGFVIKVDGETVAGDPELSTPRVQITPPRTLGRAIPSRPRGRLDVEQVSADELLERLNIQLRFDGLDVEPMLNVLPVNDRAAYAPGEYVGFVASANYPAWIEKAEIRLYSGGDTNAFAMQPVDTVPVILNSQAATEWQMPAEGADQYAYVLRVYDRAGRYDETAPLKIRRKGAVSIEQNAEEAATRTAPGFGQNRLAMRNIPVHGGAVTVNGKDVPPGYSIRVLGADVPIDRDNGFVVQQILPAGDHDVTIEILGAAKAPALTVDRLINIPANDFFYVGIADLTVGIRDGGIIEAVQDGEFDNVYTKGRLAFYLKGKVRGRYLITASADTGEAPIDELFRDFDAKGPRELIKRIDPDQFYPVYGDDSTIKEDAPTSGKFYIRVERGDSHLMWGDFDARLEGADYVRTERALYGANAVLRSEKTTKSGEQRAEITAYAAQPDTLPQRDVLRGTGGSVYFLKRQDVHVGSDRFTVELREKSTGRIVERINLERGTDYEIDYTQGVVILNKPLSASADTGGTVRDDDLGEAAVNLVAQYEYTPTSGEVDGYNFGARAQAWLGDNVRIGATRLREQTGNGADSADQTVAGADILLRKNDKTWLRGELAQSRGPGFGRTFSDDGGLTNQDIASAGVANKDALAWKVEGEVDLKDLGLKAAEGRIAGYYENRQGGFASLDYDIAVAEQLWGASLSLQAGQALALATNYDEYRNNDGKIRREIEADAAYQLNEYWKATFGVAYSDLTDPSEPEDTGQRTDIAVEIAYAPNDTDKYFVFGQATAARDSGRGENNRVGVGAEVAITETFSIEGQTSYGSTGWAADGVLVWEPDDDTRRYIGYQRSAGDEADKAGKGTSYGGLLAGSEQKFNEDWQAYTETNYDLFSNRRDLTTVYGVTYTPDEHWTWTSGFELGRVEGTVNEDVDRRALSAGLSYVKDEAIAVRMRGEFRFDDAEDDSDDITAYVFSGGVNWRADDDWRLIADLDAAYASGRDDSLRSGDYVEGTLGFAYRPVDNDRLNALFSYRYLYDLPGTDQVNVNGETDGPRQRSHVLSADAIWQANKYLSVGGKYGFRIGEVETDRGSGDFNESSAHLVVARADIHVLHNWDALLEGRVLWSPSAQTSDLGVLTGVYRHIGDKVKLGVGYNFGRFSDDLTDLTQDDQGAFINMIGKF